MVSRVNVDERLSKEREFDKLIAQAKADGKPLEELYRAKELALWDYRD